MDKKRSSISETRKKRKVQVRISKPFQDQKPSKVTEVFWLYAQNEAVSYQKSTERSGKWLIFAPNDEIDEAWRKIKEATEKGLLGGSSKASTARPNPNATSSKNKVICVYTYDWKDESDVMRVREELKRLGFTQKIPYKSDEDTLKGKYANRGNTRISKYYC